MPIKKRSKSFDITAKTGSIGSAIPTAKSAATPFTDTVSSAASPFKGADLSAVAMLRAAKKKKPEGDVSLGKTEVSTEQAQAPRDSKYLERLRKRAK